jgi:hypothetical protein
VCELGGVVLVVVHAHHDGEVVVLGGGADEHLLGARGEVGRGLLLVGEEAGALEHHVDAELLPGELFRVLSPSDLDLVVDHLMKPSVARRRRSRNSRWMLS